MTALAKPVRKRTKAVNKEDIARLEKEIADLNMALAQSKAGTLAFEKAWKQQQVINAELYNENFRARREYTKYYNLLKYGGKLTEDVKFDEKLALTTPGRRITII